MLEDRKQYCFRHPTQEAVAYCKACSHPLCSDCSQQSFGDQTQVCSEVCAEAARQQPDPDEGLDRPIDRLFAKGFIAVLVVVLGGGIGGFLFALGATTTFFRLQHLQPHNTYYRPSDRHNYDPRYSPFRIFYDLGITDWHVLFALGAVLGIAFCILWLKFGAKVAGVAFFSLAAALTLWAVGTVHGG
jgi:hypothetical protein